MPQLSPQKLSKKLQLAQLELTQGSPAKAVKMFEKLLKPSSNNPNILYLIGLAYGKMGKSEMVKQVSLKTLKAAPNHHGTLCNLANILLLEGDLQGALDNYQKALLQKPNEPRIVDGYSKVLLNLGRHEEALALLDKLLQKYPQYSRAYVGKGEAYTQTGQQEIAFESYQTALKLDPLSADANLGLGNLYQYAGNLLQSERYYQAVLNIDEGHVFAHIGLASLKRLVGDYDLALRIIGKSEEFFPDHPFILATKADILEHAGEFDASFELLQLLKERNQLTTISITSFANMCFRFKACDEALKLLKQTVESQTTSNVQKSVLYYSSGNILDKLQRYDEAFKHYRLANTCVGNDFDEKHTPEFVNNCIKTYTSESLKRYPSSNIYSSRPIFILGMPRSGTSLCEQILAAHPDVFGAGELGQISDIAKEVAKLESKYGGDNTSWMSNIPVDIVDTYAGQYLNNLASLSSTERYVTDKMPHNFQHIGLISMLFPQARIIHCTRNPLDNILSIYFQNFSGSHTYATSLKNTALHYNYYRQLMSHWETVIDIPILTISYERMVSQQEVTTRELLEFCELEWNDDVLQFHKTKRSVGTASYEQVRQPMYQTSKGRWKNYERYLEEIKSIINY